MTKRRLRNMRQRKQEGRAYAARLSNGFELMTYQPTPRLTGMRMAAR